MQFASRQSLPRQLRDDDHRHHPRARYCLVTAATLQGASHCWRFRAALPGCAIGLLTCLSTQPRMSAIARGRLCLCARGVLTRLRRVMLRRLRHATCLSAAGSRASVKPGAEREGRCICSRLARARDLQQLAIKPDLATAKSDVTLALPSPTTATMRHNQHAIPAAPKKLLRRSGRQLPEPRPATRATHLI